MSPIRRDKLTDLYKPGKPIVQEKKPHKVVYTLKLLVGDNPPVQLGVRQTNSYKVALTEAERWALTDQKYIAEIEWETTMGLKSFKLDFPSVQEQRKARIEYRHAIKTNQFRTPYISA